MHKIFGRGFICHRSELQILAPDTHLPKSSDMVVRGCPMAVGWDYGIHCKKNLDEY